MCCNGGRQRLIHQERKVEEDPESVAAIRIHTSRVLDGQFESLAFRILILLRMAALSIHASISWTAAGPA